MVLDFTAIDKFNAEREKRKINLMAGRTDEKVAVWINEHTVIYVAPGREQEARDKYLTKLRESKNTKAVSESVSENNKTEEDS